ncbi:hypothetical protein OIU74_008163, partial [Salix koriyanagi]
MLILGLLSFSAEVFFAHGLQL